MISIDTTYQTVLALANKEQRGYITPQEFNLYANVAQMSIFEQYFYDLNQFKRVPGNDTNYADMVDLLEEKISIFKKGPTSVSHGTSLSALPGSTDYTFYRCDDVVDTSRNKVIEEIKSGDIYKTQYSPLIKATTSSPVYYKKDGKIYFIPTTVSPKVNWIRKPLDPNWTYIVVNEKPLYNHGAAGQMDFELHSSEQVELVVKILQLAGIAIKDLNLVQVAAQEENRSIQQQKQ